MNAISAVAFGGKQRGIRLPGQPFHTSIVLWDDGGGAKADGHISK